MKKKKKKATGSRKMTAARKAKAAKGRTTTVAQQSERVQRAFELMLVHRPIGVRRTLMAEYDIAKSSADSIISRANKLIRAEFDKLREEHVCMVLHQIEDEILRAKGMVRLKAIEMKMSLLGLNAPQTFKGSLDVTERPYDPARMRAMKDPKLRAKILKIEEEVSDQGESNEGQTPE